MLPWIRTTLVERRHGAGITLRELEELTGRRESNLSRFETGKAPNPRDIDALVEGYAQALGVEPVALWRDAVVRWEAATKASREVTAAKAKTRRQRGRAGA